MNAKKSMVGDRGDPNVVYRSCIRSVASGSTGGRHSTVASSNQTVGQEGGHAELGDFLRGESAPEVSEAMVRNVEPALLNQAIKVLSERARHVLP